MLFAPDCFWARKLRFSGLGEGSSLGALAKWERPVGPLRRQEHEEIVATDETRTKHGKEAPCSVVPLMPRPLIRVQSVFHLWLHGFLYFPRPSPHVPRPLSFTLHHRSLAVSCKLALGHPDIEGDWGLGIGGALLPTALCLLLSIQAAWRWPATSARRRRSPAGRQTRSPPPRPC